MYRHAVIGDLIELRVIHARLCVGCAMPKRGSRKLLDLMAKRERVYDELCSHGLKEHAADIVHDRPRSISEKENHA